MYCGASVRRVGIIRGVSHFSHHFNLLARELNRFKNPAGTTGYSSQ